MQTEVIDREGYCQLLKKTDVQQRILRNITHCMSKHGIADAAYDKQLTAFMNFTGLEQAYAEQAMHGHPVWRDVPTLCEKFGIEQDTLIFGELPAA